jgi:tetratricopeptide (TPR) repeat protein
MKDNARKREVGSSSRQKAGRISPVVLVGLAVVLILSLVVLALCPDKKGGKPTPLESVGSISGKQAASVPPDHYTQPVSPEIILSINNSCDGQTLSLGLECLFQIEIINRRAHLARLQAGQKEMLKKIHNRRKSEDRPAQITAESGPDESPRIQAAPIRLGTEKTPWADMIHIYAVRAGAGTDGDPLELSPELLSEAGNLSHELILDGDNEGRLEYAGSPEGMKLDNGDFLIYAALIPQHDIELPHNHFKREVRSVAVPVTITDSAESASAEDQDLLTYTQAAIALSRGDAERAKGLLDEGIRLNPEAVMAHILMADILEAEERFEEAMESLKTAYETVLGKRAQREEFMEPPSHLIEKISRLQEKIDKSK